LEYGGVDINGATLTTSLNKTSFVPGEEIAVTATVTVPVNTNSVYSNPNEHGPNPAIYIWANNGVTNSLHAYTQSHNQSTDMLASYSHKII
jgi:hypothetical protein